ncbi:hypothetical protein A7B51_00110 [Lentilactobacillus parabuchneri]|jgi:hypothetical protein|uniref:hypothetical protein n=1 Tax=Lentilactobacillus parabuchneri TaxID=152331 RepID=UPI0007F977E0|nr:hypothetical protein [Lentilactobacillus parabuchneri]OBU97813.1 hypothetical protein A7B51_00110 [Lentilactobacillus parabuchneri]DAZ30561.1 MAG TPA: hypothetical protein [Caudoviricetes sp.]
MLQIKSENNVNTIAFDGQVDGVTLKFEVDLDDATLINTVKAIAPNTSFAESLFKTALNKISTANFNKKSNEGSNGTDPVQAAK